MLLAYSPREVGGPLGLLLAGVNGAVALAAIFIMIIARTMWRPALAGLDLGGASLIPPVCVAIAFAVVITGANIATLRRHLGRLWWGD